MSEVTRGVVNKFNRGEVDPAAFAREDLDQINNSCQLMRNFLPKRLGPMVFRPGFEYIHSTVAGTKLIPFVSSSTETALLELGVVINFTVDGVRQQVETQAAFSDASMSTGSGWTNDDQGSAASTFDLGWLNQVGTGTDVARVYNSVTVVASSEYTYRVHVTTGPVRVQFGDAASGTEYFDEFLDEGYHAITVTPTTTSLFVTISNSKKYTTTVEAVDALTVGDLGIPFDNNITGMDSALFEDLRWDQSANKLYVVGKGMRPVVITRYDTKSWGLSLYRNIHGPYDPINTTEITLNPNSTDGDVYMPTSEPVYLEGNNMGLLLRYASIGQLETATGTTNSVETDTIYVFGTGDARKFEVDITVNSGSYNVIKLQKSFDDVTFTDVKEYVAGTTVVEEYDDALDGAEIYYKLNVTDVGTANVTLTLDYSYGTVEGEFRSENDHMSIGGPTGIYGYWYVDAGSHDASMDWYLGSWRWDVDTVSGSFPTSVAFFEGRLWFGGHNKFWASESDFYASHDRSIEGASAAIEKTIGFGPVETVDWLVGTDYLFAGLASAELNVRSNSFAEPMTSINTNIKQISSNGVAPIRPAVIDTMVLYAQRGLTRLMAMDFNGNKASTRDLNMINQEICSAGIRRIEVTRNPETRVWVLLDDNTLVTVLLEEVENILAWSKVQSAAGGGTVFITDICTLPAAGEDELYLTVLRSGVLSTLERMSQFGNAIGGNVSEHYDSWVKYTSPGTSILGTHFTDTTEVAVWVDGVYDGEYTAASGGDITGITSGTDVVIGYKYDADYTSNKLTDHSGLSTINARQRIINTGLVMRNYVAGSVTVGPDSSNLDILPLLEDGKTPTSGDYDFFPFAFSGTSEVDPRIHIKATAPCEIMALTYDMKNTDHRTKKATK